MKYTKRIYSNINKECKIKYKIESETTLELKKNLFEILILVIKL